MVFARTSLPVLIFFTLGMGAAGCGPAPPAVVLEAPKDAPATWQDRRLFNTPQAYIYARTDLAAGEADRWVKQVKDYIKRKHGRDLDKGIVVVMDPVDAPIVHSVEEDVSITRDPALIRTPMRHPKPVAKIRQDLIDNGIPEAAAMRGETVPLSPARLSKMNLSVPEAGWAVAAPSHELAVVAGEDVLAGALQKKKPDMTGEQARKAAEMFPNMAAKPFEADRGGPVFVLWVQRQADWSDDQRRQAILTYIKDTLRANGAAPPPDEELEW